MRPSISELSGRLFASGNPLFIAAFLLLFAIFFPAYIIWFTSNAVLFGFFTIVFGEHSLDLNTAKGRLGAKLAWIPFGGSLCVGLAAALTEAVLLIGKIG